MTYDAAEKGAEKRLGWEVVTNFFQTEQDTANWSSKGDGDTGSSTGTEYFSAFAVIVPVFWEHTARNVANGGSNVDIRAFLAKTETRCHTEDQA